MERAKLIVEVTAGLIPGQPIDEYTKRFAITGADWEEASLREQTRQGAAKDRDGRPALLAEVNGRAQGYAGYLMMQPDALNWVRTDWIWL